MTPVDMKTKLCPNHQLRYVALCSLCPTKEDALIKKLQADVEAWKIAWYSQREIIGELSWMVPNIDVLKQSSSPFFQKQYARFKEFANSNQEIIIDCSPQFEPDPFQTKVNN